MKPAPPNHQAITWPGGTSRWRTRSFKPGELFWGSYFRIVERVARFGNGELAQAVTWPLARVGRGYSRRLLGGDFPTDRRIFARESAVHQLRHSLLRGRSRRGGLLPFDSRRQVSRAGAASVHLRR